MLGRNGGENHLADAVFLLFDYGEKETVAAKGNKHEENDTDEERDDGFAESISVATVLGEFIVDNFVTVGEGDDIERINTGSGVLSHNSPQDAGVVIEDLEPFGDVVKFGFFTLSEIGGDIKIVIRLAVFNHFDTFVFVAMDEIGNLLRQDAGIVDNGDFSIFVEGGLFLVVNGSSETNKVD